MSESGLSEEEEAKLRLAGFSAPVTAAVSREAASMHFLFLRRQSVNLWAGVAGGLAAVVAGAANIFGEGFAWLVSVVVPALGGLLALGPWLEIRMMRQHEPVRWAARRLAVLAVTADPEDREGDNWRSLTRFARWAARLESPRSVLRYLAREMIEEETGINPRNPAPNRTLTVDQAQLSDTILRAVAVVSVLVIIALLAARILMGAEG
jgi:hypothetical protein